MQKYKGISSTLKFWGRLALNTPATMPNFAMVAIGGALWTVPTYCSPQYIDPLTKIRP